jgi:hypothetical protein
VAVVRGAAKPIEATALPGLGNICWLLYPGLSSFVATRVRPEGLTFKSSPAFQASRQGARPSGLVARELGLKA